MSRHFLAATSDLLVGRLKRIEVAGNPICVARTEQGIYAIADPCSHEGASLSEGDLVGLDVECPLHSSRFDIRSGAVRGLPALHPAECFPVTVEGDEVFIDL
jgi:3-phenylpropionate/trans-cinnamate dioxygenase ferredoxin component